MKVDLTLEAKVFKFMWQGVSVTRIEAQAVLFDGLFANEIIEFCPYNTLDLVFCIHKEAKRIIPDGKYKRYLYPEENLCIYILNEEKNKTFKFMNGECKSHSYDKKETREELVPHIKIRLLYHHIYEFIEKM